MSPRQTTGKGRRNITSPRSGTWQGSWFFSTREAVRTNANPEWARAMGVLAWKQRTVGLWNPYSGFHALIKGLS